MVYDDSLYISVISKELVNRNIKHFNPASNMVCYSSIQWLEYDQSVAYINSFYRNAATLIKSRDLKQAGVFLEMLDKKGKAYNSSLTDEGDMFIVIFSRSPQEELNNRKLLSEI